MTASRRMPAVAAVAAPRWTVGRFVALTCASVGGAKTRTPPGNRICGTEIFRSQLAHAWYGRRGEASSCAARGLQ